VSNGGIGMQLNDETEKEVDANVDNDDKNDDINDDDKQLGNNGRW